MKCGSQQGWQVQDPGALGADGSNAEGAKVMAPRWAEYVECPPPQRLPNGPRDLAHAHRRSVGRDVLNRLLLVIADEGVEVAGECGFPGSGI